MARLNDLSREYEARHFPPTRQLDLHGEGPESAQRRALRWIQSFAHEEPGSELLLVVERGGRPRGRASVVRQSVEALLGRLAGGLIDWWQPFGSDSIALRVALDPRISPPAPPEPIDPRDEGRTPETASAAPPDPDADIPGELLPVARRAAELRRAREDLSIGLLGVVLRQVWIEAQATAMNERTSFGAALDRVLREEEGRIYEGE